MMGLQLLSSLLYTKGRMEREEERMRGVSIVGREATGNYNAI